MRCTVDGETNHMTSHDLCTLPEQQHSHEPKGFEGVGIQLYTPPLDQRFS